MVIVVTRYKNGYSLVSDGDSKLNHVYPVKEVGTLVADLLSELGVVGVEHVPASRLKETLGKDFTKESWNDNLPTGSEAVFFDTETVPF